MNLTCRIGASTARSVESCFESTRMDSAGGMDGTGNTMRDCCCCSCDSDADLDTCTSKLGPPLEPFCVGLLPVPPLLLVVPFVVWPFEGSPLLLVGFDGLEKGEDACCCCCCGDAWG